MFELDGAGVSRSSTKQKRISKQKNSSLQRICNILKQIGWKKKWIDRYNRLYGNHDLEDEDDEYWIEQEFVNQYKTIPQASFIDILCNSGFKKILQKLYGSM
jgi:hypothetical protein